MERGFRNEARIDHTQSLATVASLLLAYVTKRKKSNKTDVSFRHWFTLPKEKAKNLSQ